VWGERKGWLVIVGSNERQSLRVQREVRQFPTSGSYHFHITQCLMDSEWRTALSDVAVDPEEIYTWGIQHNGRLKITYVGVCSSTYSPVTLDFTDVFTLQRLLETMTVKGLRIPTRTEHSRMDSTGSMKQKKSTELLPKLRSI
jgi:hypothetical protein